jgi:hypothetical protein
MNTATTLGHNSGFSDYYALRMAIWDSEEPLIAKALALAILEHMRPDKLEAFPSRARLAKMCGISENTLERHWNTIRQWVDIVRQHGRQNLYRARVYLCAKELEVMLPGKVPPTVGGTPAEAPPPTVGGTLPEPPPTVGVPPRVGTPQSGGYTTPHSGGIEDSIEDSRYPLVSARVIVNPPHWAYNATLDAEERKAQHDVGWTENGTLVAMNGFEVQLMRDFPRVNLTAGLAAATGNQLPAKSKATAKQLKGAILRQFGFMEQDEASRDRRAAARPQLPAPQVPNWRDEKAARMRRINDALDRAERNLEGCANR